MRAGGYLRRLEVAGEMRDGPWRTRMARLAAAEHDADWVINTDADEFWMPRRGTLRELFASIPETHGVVFALSRHFVPRPEEGATSQSAYSHVRLCRLRRRSDANRLDAQSLQLTGLPVACAGSSSSLQAAS